MLIMFMHLDDVLIFFQYEVGHVVHVHQVLERLLQHQLFVKTELFDFNQMRYRSQGLPSCRDKIK